MFIPFSPNKAPFLNSKGAILLQIGTVPEYEEISIEHNTVLPPLPTAQAKGGGGPLTRQQLGGK